MGRPPFSFTYKYQKGVGKLARETIGVPITGKIISVNVKVGDMVKEGDVLCILESMKMENPILAPVDGTIVEVGVTVDQVVKPGGIIAVIEY
jgi:biotin carboxyl carrier protein